MSEVIHDKINELLKAIRSSQRNIALVCFVTLASIWGFDGNDLEAVDTELQQVRSLASTWDTSAVWLSEWASSTTGFGSSPVLLDNPLVFAPQDHGSDHVDAYKNPGLVAKSVEAWSVLPLPGALDALREQARRSDRSEGRPEIHLAMPANIAEFKDFWNDLGRITVKSISLDPPPFPRRLRYRRLYFAEDIDEASDRWFDEILNIRRDTSFDDRFSEVVLKLTGVDTSKGSFTDLRCGVESWWCRSDGHLRYDAVLFSSTLLSRGDGRGDTDTIAIPVNADEETSSARMALRAFYEKKTNAVAGWSDTEFELAFPALSRYAENGRETLRLNDLHIVVQSDLARNPDRISVFGATIPIGDIGFWVVSAVLALQIFFATQLVELRRLLVSEQIDPHAISEPWIGIFPGFFGRAAVISATVVLPAGLALFINIQTFGTAMSSALIALGIVSSLLGAYTAFLIWNSGQQSGSS